MDDIDYEKAGYAAYKENENSERAFIRLFPKTPARKRFSEQSIHESPTKELNAFFTAWQKAENDSNQRKLQSWGIEEFMAKYKALCKEYGVKISTGCGCCDGGAWMRNISINVETE